MQRELFGERHPDIAISLNNLGSWYAEQGHMQSALSYSEQALAMFRNVFGERHPSTIEAAANVAVNLARLNRRKEAYALVRRFVLLAQGSVKEELEQLESQLLSQPLPGFRPVSKSGKRKAKKKRR